MDLVFQIATVEVDTGSTPSKFERKIISLPRILYPFKLAQETTGKHALIYQEQKL